MAKKKTEGTRGLSDPPVADAEGTDETATPEAATDASGGVLEVIPGTEAVIAADEAMGFGERTEVPVYLKRAWGRTELPYQVGDCIGRVTLPEGVDLNLFVDAVRNDFAGDRH